MMVKVEEIDRQIHRKIGLHFTGQTVNRCLLPASNDPCISDLIILHGLVTGLPWPWPRTPHTAKCFTTYMRVWECAFIPARLAKTMSLRESFTLCAISLYQYHQKIRYILH